MVGECYEWFLCYLTWKSGTQKDSENKGSLDNSFGLCTVPTFYPSYLRPRDNLKNTPKRYFQKAEGSTKVLQKFPRSGELLEEAVSTREVFLDVECSRGLEKCIEEASKWCREAQKVQKGVKLGNQEDAGKL